MKPGSFHLCGLLWSHKAQDGVLWTSLRRTTETGMVMWDACAAEDTLTEMRVTVTLLLWREDLKPKILSTSPFSCWPFWSMSTKWMNVGGSPLSSNYDSTAGYF